MKAEKQDNIAVEEFAFTVMKNSNVLEAWSENVKMVFMLHGSGWLSMEGAETTYTVSGEDVFVINSFQMYSLVLEEDALAIVLLISPSFIHACSPEISSPNIVCKSFLYREDKQQAFDLLRRDFALAFRAWYKNESEYSVHLRSRVMVLVDNLFRNFLKANQGICRESGREGIRTAVDYIHQNYRDNITLGDLAAHNYLSVSYISRSFQKYLGMTFTTYLNRVRVLQATALLGSEKTVTEIAYESGFSSASALTGAFKQYYGMTPGQYRRSADFGERQKKKAETVTVTEEGFSTSFAALMKYADEQEVKTTFQAVAWEISVNSRSVGSRLKHSWKTLINIGYARELLNDAMQRQVARLQKTVGFRYIRCKGILDDDMMLYTRDVYGNMAANYVYMDQVLDFILSVQGKPMLELGHMPLALAKNKTHIFKRPVCISPPEDPRQWQQLIAGLMEHLVERYGIEELKQWLFVPWVSVDLHKFWLFTLEDFEVVYSLAYRAIKETSSELRICGPGTTAEFPEIRNWYIDMCRRQGCMPDVFTLRAFAAVDPEKEKSGLKLVETNESFYLAVSGDEAYLEHIGKEIKAFLEQEELGEIPVMLDEWSNNIWQRDLCNDTCYKSAYIFKSVMENHDRFHGMGYFNVSDRLDEIAPAAETFHGGFGLFTQNGFPKSAYRAMQLLNRAGDKLLAEGEGYFITSSEQEIQIFLHNYCHYDMLYRYRNTTKLTRTERYRVFNEKQPVSFHISLEGIGAGKHTVRRYGIGPGGGSTYDAWIAMGAQEPMTEEEKRVLYRQSYPVYRSDIMKTEETLKIKAFLQPHEVQLITVSI